MAMAGGEPFLEPVKLFLKSTNKIFFKVLGVSCRLGRFWGGFGGDWAGRLWL